MSIEEGAVIVIVLIVVAIFAEWYGQRKGQDGPWGEGDINVKEGHELVESTLERQKDEIQQLKYEKSQLEERLITINREG